MLTTLALVTANASPLNPEAFTVLDDRLDPDTPAVIDADGPTIRYGGGLRYTGVVVDGVAIFTFETIDLNVDVEVIGGLPVALLATGDVRVNATIDASADGSEPGPGGGAGGVDEDGEAGDGTGGGRSAAGAGGGGFGGDGGDGWFAGRGGEAYGDLAVRLEAGSGGARPVRVPPVAGDPGGAGGGGGGGFELVALGRLEITRRAVIRADGGHGEASDEAGGGGGSGGGILLRGNGGVCDGLLTANGGRGGDPGGQLVSSGGGGGGGRIAVFDLPRLCDVEAEGGRSLGNSGDGGLIRSGSSEGLEGGMDGPDGPPGPGGPGEGRPDRSLAFDPDVSTGDGCRCGSAPGAGWWWLAALALIRRR